MAFPHLFVRFLARRDPAEIARQYSRAVPAAWRSSFQCNDRGTIAAFRLWQLSREGPILGRQGQRSAAPLSPHWLPHLARRRWQRVLNKIGEDEIPPASALGVCSKKASAQAPKNESMSQHLYQFCPRCAHPLRSIPPGREIAPQLPILWVSPFSRPQSCSGRPD
jgi:hypothetical protein